jgi:hypothetical protein
MPRLLPRVSLALAAALWLGGCAGQGGLFQGEGPVPAFRDAGTTVAAAQAAVIAGTSTRADVAATLGPAAVVPFDSGYEVWVYRVREPGVAAGKTELVILFDPSGVVKKVRVRRPPPP